MKLKRNLGVLLLVGAFVFAAAGNAARGLSSEPGIFGILGTKQVLEVLTPTILISIEQIILTHLHPLIWDPLILGILALPGWFLIGLPGAIMVWKYRQIPVGGEATKEELAYNTYEDVLAAAKEADFENSEEPSKYKNFQEYDPLYPPNDGVQYTTYLKQPAETSDLADFRNKIIDMPSDIGVSPEENSEPSSVYVDPSKLINPEPNHFSSTANDSTPTLIEDNDK